MKKVLLLISLIISSIVSAQVLVIDGTHHLISENTFPLYLNGGTQLDFFTPPISLISGIEYNIVSNETGNDLSFNQVISITESSIVPDNKVWKLVSMMNHTETVVISDSLNEVLGGYVIEINGSGGGLILWASWSGYWDQAGSHNYCETKVADGYDDWVLPTKDQLLLIHEANSIYNWIEFPNQWYWSSSSNYVVNLESGEETTYTNNSGLYCTCVRQF